MADNDTAHEEDEFDRQDIAIVKPISGPPIVEHVVLDRHRGKNVRTRCVISRSGAVSIGDIVNGDEIHVHGFTVVDLPRTELRRWLVAAIDMLDQ